MDYVGIIEAAKQLKKSARQLRDMDTKGTFPCAKRNERNQRLYSKDQITKYLAGHSTAMVPAHPKDDRPNRVQLLKYAAGLSGVEVHMPGTNGLTISPPQEYSGVFYGGRDFYLNPDNAIRNSRENARNMLNTPAIYESLQARRLATAELEGAVEPPDQKDAVQVMVSETLERHLHEMPDLLKFKNQLLWAVWHGRSGAQMQYRPTFDNVINRHVLKPVGWSPVQGDSLEFKFNGRLGVLVSNTRGGAPGLKELNPEQLEGSDVNMTYVLNDVEREAFVVHTHDIVGSDHFDPQAAGSVKGLGLRTWVYFPWLVSRQVRGWMLEHLERVGAGLTIYYFIRGDEQSYLSAQELAASNSSQGYILAPIDLMPGARVPTVERVEPSGAGIDNMLKVIESDYEANMRRIICGQDATSQPTKGTGLNSDSATVMESTFFRLVKYDAINMDQTITDELLAVMQKYSFPETVGKFKCRYRTATEKPDPKQFIEGAKAIYEMGGPIDMTELYGIVGLTVPDSGVHVLQKPAGMEAPFPKNPSTSPGESMIPGDPAKVL